MNHYVVLARKYRPQVFEDLVGQETITKTLKNAITLGRIPHALLLTGTRGVGKTTTARIFAKALNCEKGPTPTPCGVCSNCVEITQGTSVDVYEIDGASNTSVDDVRSLKENVQYAPSKSRFKIYIIDEVHMLSTSAFNALLKTLEEPPAGVYFVFATTESHKIPDTILSRCQRYDFRQITDEQVEKHLKNILQKENINMSGTAISLVARQGNGSLRDALSLLDQVIAMSGEKISDDEVVASLGLTDRALIRQTLESFMEYDPNKALAVVSSVFEKGFDSKVYLTEIWEWIRNMIVYKHSPKKELVALSPDELSLIEGWIPKVEVEELERWFDLVKGALMSLGRIEFPRYVIEVTFLKITRNSKRVMIQDLLNKLDQMEGSTGTSTKTSGQAAAPSPSSPKVSVPVTSASAPTTSGPTVSALASDDWSSLMEELKKIKPISASLISKAVEASWKDNVISLSFEGSFNATRAQEEDFQQFVIDIANRISKTSNKIKVGQVSGTATAVEKPASKERPKLDIPIVQKAVSIFDATVDDITPVD
ncbi:MAG: DNA polymerase III subunit gamma/tau [Bdellovibrionota bacterium]